MSKSNGGKSGGSRPAPLPPNNGPKPAGWPTSNGTSNPSGSGRNNAPPKK